jgi:hypothetical protein
MFTMATPMVSSANVRTSTFQNSSPRDWPSAAARLNASGIETPAMKRNAGNTMSGSVIASALALACRSQLGARATPARSLTKIINVITSPRKASTDAMRSRAEAGAGTGDSAGTGTAADGSEFMVSLDRGADC